MGKVLGIYGAGGMGREILELAKIINKKECTWEEFVFIDDGNVAPVINSVPVYSYVNAKEKYLSNLEVTVGIGEPITREKIFCKLKADNIDTPTLIHPEVVIPETTSVGEGVTINMGSFVSCNVKIEDYVYIQPHTNIGHDDVLKEGSMISGFCNLAGAVTIGKYTYLGLSVAVKQLVRIGDYSVIGMGSIVYKDIEDDVIAMGNPARAMKKNEEKKVFK